MNFHGNESNVNFSPELQPLFDAMMRGDVIKSITFCAGEINRHDRSKDVTFTNFKATDYWEGMAYNSTKREWHDYVDEFVERTEQFLTGAKTRGFYMSWVLSFEL